MQKTGFSESLAKLIIKNRVVIAIIFILAFAFSLVSMNWTKVEEDIVQFLPDGAESKVCVDIMQTNFVTYGSGQIVLENVTDSDADVVVNTLQNIPHVKSVTFDKASHFKDGKALIDFSLDTRIKTKANTQTFDKIRKSLKTYDFSISNPSENDISAIVADQMKFVLAIVAVVVVAILLFTSQSYGEVIVLLLTFIMAAILNYGTNFLFGTVSMISNSVSVVLQLALSVDYAVIMCHRYREERLRYDKKDAAVSALSSSFAAILSSSLTTVAGLFAMTLMQFRLGFDLGRMLIKAIILSLITVFAFTPFLLILFDKLIERTKHKSFVPKVSFIGKFANATRFVFPILIVLLLTFGGFMTTRTKYAYDELLTPAKSECENDHASRISLVDFKDNTCALLLPAGDYASEQMLYNDLIDNKNVREVTALASIPAIDDYLLGDYIKFRDFMEIADIGETEAKALFVYYAADRGEHRSLGDIEKYRIPLVDLMVFLHDDCLDNPDLQIELTEEQVNMVNDVYKDLAYAREQLISDDYSRIIIRTDLPLQSEETYEFLDYIHESAEKYYSADDVLVSGNSMINYDFNKSFSTDNVIVSILSILFVLVILIFTFHSLALPVILVILIQSSIWTNFAITSLKGNYVFFVCYLIVTAIQMGSNIDYAIVLSSRYIEMRQTKDKKESIIDAVNLAFPTILTTGLMMIFAGLLISLFVSEAAIAGIGHYVCTGAAITLVLVLFALPQLLLIGDRFFVKPAKKATEE